MRKEGYYKVPERGYKAIVNNHYLAWSHLSDFFLRGSNAQFLEKHITKIVYVDPQELDKIAQERINPPYYAESTAFAQRLFSLEIADTYLKSDINIIYPEVTASRPGQLVIAVSNTLEGSPAEIAGLSAWLTYEDGALNKVDYLYQAGEKTAVFNHTANHWKFAYLLGIFLFSHQEDSHLS